MGNQPRISITDFPPGVQAALREDARPDFEACATDATVTPERIRHFGDVPVITTEELDLSRPDFGEIIEREAVAKLRDAAEHHTESDGFDAGALRDMVHALESDGHRAGVGLTDNFDVFDSARGVRESEVNGVGTVDFYGWHVAPTGTDGLLDGEVLLMAEDAVVPDHRAEGGILVRHPSGVAHYEF